MLNAKLFRLMSVIMCLAAPAAFADPVTTEITGVVSFSNGIYGDIAVGSAVDAFFTVDPSQANNASIQPGETSVGYLSRSFGNGDPFVSSEVFVNGVNVGLDPTALSDVNWVYGQVNSTGPGGFFDNSSSFFLTAQYGWGSNNYQSDYGISANDGSAYSLDGAIPQLTSSDSGNGVLNLNNNVLAYTVLSAHTVAAPKSDASVPAPFSLGLLSFGLLGAALRRRAPKTATRV
jgi:hypothetical protein